MFLLLCFIAHPGGSTHSTAASLIQWDEHFHFSVYSPLSVREASALRLCCVFQGGSVSWFSGQCDDSLQVPSLQRRSTKSVVTPPLCTPPSLYLTHWRASVSACARWFCPFENAGRKKPVPAEEKAGRDVEAGVYWEPVYCSAHVFFHVTFQLAQKQGTNFFKDLCLLKQNWIFLHCQTPAIKTIQQYDS